MKKLFTALLIIIAVGVVAGAVASMAAKKRLEAMSDDEIREFLASKLEGKVDEEQIATIQEATITGIRKKMGRPEPTIDAESVEEAVSSNGVVEDLVTDSDDAGEDDSEASDGTESDDSETIST